MRKIFSQKTVLLATLLLMLSAFSTANAQARKDIEDPWEGFNRLMFGFNNTLDTFLLRPTAIAYRTVVPLPMRDSLRNVIDNLGTPVILMNDVLQGDGDRAWNTVARFALNTTFGIAGLYDAGTHFGYPKHEEDFGQTLGTWGVDGGPYVVLPIFGPSNVRDVFGRIGDYAMNPLTYVVAKNNEDYPLILLSVTTADVIDARSRNMESFDSIRENSLDYYATIRSLYTQNRRARIANQETSKDQNFDDLDFEFEN